MTWWVLLCMQMKNIIKIYCISESKYLYGQQKLGFAVTFILYTTLNLLYFDTKNIIKWVIFGELVSFRSAKITVTHFVWNQDEVAQNSREAKRLYCTSKKAQRSDNAPLSGSCQANQLRSVSLLLGTLSHGAHKPISIVLRTCFLDAPACGSKHSLAVIFIPCMTLYSPIFTLYFKLNF